MSDYKGAALMLDAPVLISDRGCNATGFARRSAPEVPARAFQAGPVATPRSATERRPIATATASRSCSVA